MAKAAAQTDKPQTEQTQTVKHTYFFPASGESVEAESQEAALKQVGQKK